MVPAFTGPWIWPLTMTWSACTAPSTLAVAEITSRPGVPGPTRTSPTTSPSIRKPSVNSTLPSMRLPSAIRLLMGGCLLRENMFNTPMAGWTLRRGALTGRACRSVFQRKCLGGPCCATFQHADGDGFYHGMGGEVDHAFQAPVLAQLQCLALAWECAGPRLAFACAGQHQLHLPLEFWSILEGAHHECLPSQMHSCNDFSLKASDGDAVGVGASRDEFFKQAQVFAQRTVFCLGLAQSCGELLQGGPFGQQEASRGVHKGLMPLGLVLQALHLGT